MWRIRTGSRFRWAARINSVKARKANHSDGMIICRPQRSVLAGNWLIGDRSGVPAATDRRR